MSVDHIQCPAALVGNIKYKTVSDSKIVVKYNEFSKHSIKIKHESSTCIYPEA